MKRRTKRIVPARRRVQRTGERGLPLWPYEKPLPNFKSYQQEIAWWHSHDLEEPPDSTWRRVEHIAQASRQPRRHVYRVRLDDQEMAILRGLARQDGVSASVVIRQLVRKQAR